MLKTGLLIVADDWQGLYIDGALVGEDHSLDDGVFWLNMAHQYKLGSYITENIADCDSSEIDRQGSFPRYLTDLNGDYSGNK